MPHKSQIYSFWSLLITNLHHTLYALCSGEETRHFAKLVLMIMLKTFTPDFITAVKPRNFWNSLPLCHSSLSLALTIGA
jgi:hypothetical protein